MVPFHISEEIIKFAQERNVDLESIYSDIPSECFEDVDLPSGLDEHILIRKIYNMMQKNYSAMDYSFFLGDGIYNHYVPPAVREIIFRSEFMTAYTPYQPEISQGMLKTLFEYQSIVAELSGMEVANSSMYDGFSALGEAVRMSKRIADGEEVLIPANMHPSKKSVIKNYVKGLNLKLIEMPYDNLTGELDIEKVKALINDKTLSIVVESPNRFGILEEALPDIRSIIGNKIFIMFADPLSLSIFKSPGELDADIYVGEGQSLGLNMNFGGPLVGLFATKKKYVRKMPGRIIGHTHDSNGKDAYCMTLQTREQHIKRADATSNICTNNALMAVAFTVYIALQGADGLEKVAVKSMENAHKLKEGLSSLPYVDMRFNGPFFNEFVYKTTYDSNIVLKRLLQKKVIGGVKLSKEECGSENCLMVASTEMNNENDIEKYLSAMRDINVSPGYIR